MSLGWFIVADINGVYRKAMQAAFLMIGLNLVLCVCIVGRSRREPRDVPLFSFVVEFIVVLLVIG